MKIGTIFAAGALAVAGVTLAAAPAQARTFVSVGIGSPGYYGGFYGPRYGYGYGGYGPRYRYVHRYGGRGIYDRGYYGPYVDRGYYDRGYYDRGYYDRRFRGRRW